MVYLIDYTDYKLRSQYIEYVFSIRSRIFHEKLRIKILNKTYYYCYIFSRILYTYNELLFLFILCYNFIA